MARLYSVRTSTITISEIRDFYEVLAGTDRPIEIYGWSLFQVSDVGDALEQILRIETVRGIGATTGSGGTSPTVAQRDDNDVATQATVLANNTTRLTVGGGSLEVLEQFGWNVRIPWVHYYLPELRPRVEPLDFWTLSSPVDVTDDLLLFGSTLWFSEL